MVKLRPASQEHWNKNNKPTVFIASGRCGGQKETD
jgi:hypothetical protein